jgi:hypothetical protein
MSDDAELRELLHQLGFHQSQIEADPAKIAAAFAAGQGVRQGRGTLLSFTC